MNHFRLITNYLQCYINILCINWISPSGHVDKLHLPLLVHHSHCHQQSVRQQVTHLGGVAGRGCSSCTDYEPMPDHIHCMQQLLHLLLVQPGLRAACMLEGA